MQKGSRSGAFFPPVLSCKKDGWETIRLSFCVFRAVFYTFSMCQISLAYSAMVRSEENLPLLQMFIQRFFAKVI